MTGWRGKQKSFLCRTRLQSLQIWRLSGWKIAAKRRRNKLYSKSIKFLTGTSKISAIRKSFLRLMNSLPVSMQARCSRERSTISASWFWERFFNFLYFLIFLPSVSSLDIRQYCNNNISKYVRWYLTKFLRLEEIWKNLLLWLKFL